MSVGVLAVDDSPTWLALLSTVLAVGHQARRSIECRLTRLLRVVPRAKAKWPQWVIRSPRRRARGLMAARSVRALWLS